MIDLRMWEPTICSGAMTFGNFTLSKEVKNEIDRLREDIAKYKKSAMPGVKKILKNGDYMTVLWADGTKTIVKRAADEPQSDYAAFTAAVGIKAYGSNSALKRIVAGAEEQGKKKKKKPATNAGEIEKRRREYAECAAELAKKLKLDADEGDILRALEEIKEGNREAYRK